MNLLAQIHRLCRRHFGAMPILAAVLGAVSATPAAALEANAGDYEFYPPGLNFALLYYQHAESSDFYSNGNKISNNFNIKSDLGVFRFDHPFKLGDRSTIELNVIVPFAHVEGSGDASALGSASGLGDVIASLPVKFLLNESNDVVSIAPFVYIPVGNYDQNKPLNIGEHRWKGLLQTAYVGHFGPHWALDAIGEILVSGRNDKLGTANAVLKQDSRYELQAHLRYIVSKATELSADVGHYWGGETEINGVDQNNRLKTTYGRIGASYFINTSTQLLGQIGRDLSVENGAKEKARINLRLAKIF